MDREIIIVLNRWMSSIERYGKLDSWGIDNDLNMLGFYLKKNHDGKRIRTLMRNIRDCAISTHCDTCYLLNQIKEVLCILGVCETFDPMKDYFNNHNRKSFQVMILKHETRKIFEERLRFKKGMYLRNFDIDSESPKDSRKVRKIVEKRMCQAFHHLNKSNKAMDNERRYREKMILKYQLKNIGQKEDLQNSSSYLHSHWKKVFDHNTGQIVLKKKVCYSSMDSALQAIRDWQKLNPNDQRELNAYICPVCGKWHVGHPNSNKTQTNKLIIRKAS